MKFEQKLAKVFAKAEKKKDWGNARDNEIMSRHWDRLSGWERIDVLEEAGVYDAESYESHDWGDLEYDIGDKVAVVARIIAEDVHKSEKKKYMEHASSDPAVMFRELADVNPNAASRLIREFIGSDFHGDWDEIKRWVHPSMWSKFIDALKYEYEGNYDRMYEKSEKKKLHGNVWNNMTREQKQDIMHSIGLSDYAYDEADLDPDVDYLEVLSGFSDLYRDDFIAAVGRFGTNKSDWNELSHRKRHNLLSEMGYKGDIDSMVTMSFGELPKRAQMALSDPFAEKNKDASRFSDNNLERVWMLMPNYQKKISLPPPAQGKIDFNRDYWDVMIDLEENGFDTDYMKESVAINVGRWTDFGKSKNKVEFYLADKWARLPRGDRLEMIDRCAAAVDPNIGADMNLPSLEKFLSSNHWGVLKEAILCKGGDRVYHALLKAAWNKFDSKKRIEFCEKAGVEARAIRMSVNKDFDNLIHTVSNCLKDFKPDRKFLGLSAAEQDLVFEAMGLNPEQSAMVRGWDPDDMAKFPFGTNSDYHVGLDAVRQMRDNPQDYKRRGRMVAL